MPFLSLFDFCARVDNRAVNKKAIEALIKCGAFGSTGATRKGMLMVLEQAQGAGQKAQQDALIGQGSIFDLMPADPPASAIDDGGFGGGDDGFVAPSHAPIPGDRVRPRRAARGREGVDRAVHFGPPAQGGQGGAARCAWTARCPTSPTARRRLGARWAE